MQDASPSAPVNGSKRVEVLHHDAMKVPETVLFQETVKVGPAVLPRSRDLIVRPDDAAGLRVHLADHRHAAAATHPMAHEI